MITTVLSPTRQFSGKPYSYKTVDPIVLDAYVKWRNFSRGIKDNTPQERFAKNMQTLLSGYVGNIARFGDSKGILSFGDNKGIPSFGDNKGIPSFGDNKGIPLFGNNISTQLQSILGQKDNRSAQIIADLQQQLSQKGQEVRDLFYENAALQAENVANSGGSSGGYGAGGSGGGSGASGGNDSGGGTTVTLSFGGAGGGTPAINYVYESAATAGGGDAGGYGGDAGGGSQPVIVD